MKKYFKVIIPIGIVTTVLVGGIVANNYRVNSKTVVLNENDLKVKSTEEEKKSGDIISLKSINKEKFDAYLMEVKDPTKIKVGTAKELGKQFEKTSEIAKANKAVAAINGGWYSEDIKGGEITSAIAISKGNIINDFNKQATPVAAIAENGLLIIGNYNVEDLKKRNVEEAVSGKVALVVNGVGSITKGDGGWGYGPRTAIGQRKDGTILLLVTDGRKNAIQMGASLFDIQQLLLDKGAVNAANLDGGYSATMYYNGQIVNIPNSWDGERSVATCFLVEP